MEGNASADSHAKRDEAGRAWMGSGARPGIARWRRARAVRARALLLACLGFASGDLHALPTGNQTVAGTATVTTSSPTSMVINQGSQRAVINWQGFGIGSGESVIFNQPNAGSVALNRVLGNNPSAIYGRLSANGQVFLVNPNGILFGPTASVDVGGLVASTLATSDTDFMAGRAQFSNGGTAGGIRNFGQLTASNGGFIALVAPDVANSGTIQANQGTVSLAAGNKVTLDFFGDDLLKIKVDEAALKAHIDSSGALLADGGQVVLSAQAAGDLMGSVINQTGVIRARGLAEKNGVIVLDGGTAGTVTVAGTLDASGAEANSGGGSIGVFGQNIALKSAKLDASGQSAGGTIRVGGDTHGTQAVVAGDPVANAQTVSIDAASTIKADAKAQGDGGKVVVWSDQNTQFNGSILARGGASSGDGGNVETSGAHLKLGPQAAVSTDAAHGRAGEWLIDPNDFTIAAAGGDMTGAALGTALESNNVTIQSSQGAASGNGDIFVNDGVVWNSSKNLTLSAQRNIAINATVSNVNSMFGPNNTITLRADSQGACIAGAANCGTVTFSGGATARAAGNSARINIYYNPTGSNGAADANGNIAGAYATPTDYSTDVAVQVVASQLYAGMLVNDVNQLQSMNTNLAGKYVLGRDIDARASSAWNAGLGFAPIGNSTTKFTGKFDGLGRSISGLTINRPLENNVGLFGAAYYTTLQNIGLLGGSITGGTSVGGLIGWNDAGWSIFGTVSNAFSSAAVTGSSAVGGLVGENRGAISKSYATGGVAGNDKVGGLVGYNNVNAIDAGTVITSYASGKVTGSTNVGGLVGSNAGTVAPTNYWDSTVNPALVAGNAAGTPLSTAQMMDHTNYDSSWGNLTNGSGTWFMIDGNTRPFLSMEYSTSIGNAHQLQLMSMNLTKSYTLARDIDMSELTRASGMWNTAAGFVPVGTLATPFTGSLDGFGHTITGLTINRSSGYLGLFGYIASPATIANVGIEGGSITGAGVDAGGLVGYSDHGNVSNAYSSATVATTRAPAGGLIAENIGGSISNSHASGNVTLSSTGVNGTGGLVGNNSGTITDSYASGNVTTSWGTVGGLVGYNFGGTTQRSYATGNVNGGNDSIRSVYAGGLVGDSWSGSYSDVYATGSVYAYAYSGGLMGHINGGSITRAYATGLATGSGGYGSGFIDFYQAGTITNSFWDKTTGKPTDESGLARGLTTAQMMTGANFNSSTADNGNVNPGWSLPGTWSIVEGTSYPYLTSIFTSTPQIVSGTAGAAGGKTIQAVANGVNLGNTSTGANGFYYFALPANSAASGKTLLTFVSGDAMKGGAAFGSTGGNVTSFDITSGDLNVAGGAASNTSLVTAAGSLSITDFPYTVSGNNLTTTNSLNFKTAAAATYTLDGNISANSHTLTSPVTLGSDATLTATAGGIAVNGALSGAHALTLSATGGISQSAAITNVSTLAASGSSVTLNNAGNTITSLGNTNTSAGAINIADSAGGLTVTGNVAAVGGALTLSTVGALAINGAVDAGGNALGLTATGGAISQSAAITNVSTLSASGSSVTLNNAGNTITNLGTTSSTAGAINIADSAGGLTVAGNVTATGGPVTLGTVGALAINSAVDAGGNALSLTATGGAISQSAAITNVTTLTATGGSVTLNNGSNTITSLGTTNSTAGAINIADSAGGVTVTGNVTAAGGPVSLSTVGAMTVSGTIDGGGNAMSLTATGASGDITVASPITWNANALTLTAGRNIAINTNLNGSGTASLALYYGQNAVASGNTGTENVNAPVNLPTGNHFSTKLGSDGAVANYSVINSLGAAGDETTGPATLQGMAATANLTGNYALGANIDASATSAWNIGQESPGVAAGFLPVGYGYGGNFRGRFDGLGHTISGLTVNRPAMDNVGLFGYIWRGTVSNVGMVGGSISGHDNVGGLAGQNGPGSINNSYATGSVTGDVYVGGLVGYSMGGVQGVPPLASITNSYATGAVSGSQYVGGLVGDNSVGIITNAYASGNVSATANTGKYIGGLIGLDFQGTTSKVYASGAVNGGTSISSSYTGGLVGYVQDMSGSFTDVYATGSATGYAGVGGLVGVNMGTITRGYASGLVSGNSSLGGFSGVNSGTITKSYWDTTTGYATGGTGNTATGKTTAQLLAQATYDPSFNFSTTWYSVDNNTRPFLRMEYGTTIGNAHQLQLMAMDPTKSYTLVRDIDMSELNRASGMWKTGVSPSGFVPVGTLATPFTGSLDGQGHTISGLTITRAGTDYAGLIGDNQGALSKVGLIGGSVSGNQYVGGLVGWNDTTGTVSQAYATAAVTAAGTDAGGLVGDNKGSLSLVYATGAVHGTANVGGLVGYNNGGSLDTAYAAGAVNNTGSSGGLVGSNSGSVATSFWDKTTSGQASSAGGTGKDTTLEMKTGTTFSDAGWSLPGTWRIYEGQTYPLLSVLLMPLSVTANAAAKTYDGNAYAGGNGVAYSGLGTGDDGSSTVLGTPVYGGLAQGAKNAGTYSLSVSGLYSNKYDITAYYDGTLTVGKAHLTVTADDKSRLYGAANPALTTTVTGFVNGEGSGTAAGYGGSGSATTLANASTNVGTATITAGAGTLAATNYDFTNLVDGTLTVGKAHLTVTADDKSRLYGAANPALTTTVTGFVNGEGSGTAAGYGGSGSATTLADASTNVGTATITAGAGTLTATDYDFANLVDGTLTINKKPLTLAATAANKTYDGNNSATVTGYGLTGFVGSQTVSGTSTAATFSDKNAANGKTVTITGIGLNDGSNGGLASNYSVASSTTATADITPASLTARVTAANKVYDATTDATITGRSLGGVIGSDAVSLAGGTASFDTKDVGTGKTVTATGLTLAGLDAGNYTASSTATTMADITPASLGVSLTAGITAANKVYDGTTAATITGRSLLGVIGGDDVSLTGGTASFDTKNVGTAKTVTAINLALSGTAAGNYTANRTATTTADITPASLTASVTAANKVYDGTAAATITSRTVSGVIGSDAVSLSGGTASFDTKNVGTGKAVTVSGTTLAGADAGNYSLTAPGALTASITPRGLAVVADDQAKIVGTADPALTYRITGDGLLGGDTLAGSLTRVAGETVDPYAITQGSLANGNYAIGFTNGTLTINPLLVATPPPVAVDPVPGAIDPSPGFLAAMPIPSLLDDKERKDSFLLKIYPTDRVDMRNESISDQTLTTSLFEVQNGGIFMPPIPESTQIAF